MSAPTSLVRAFIVEDEPAARHYLAELLSTLPGVEVVGAAAQLADLEKQGFDALAASIDVCFIDLNLGGGRANQQGLTVARALAATTPPPVLVFATASRHHAFEGIEVGVADYLRKPFDQRRVAATLERVRARLAPRPQRLPRRLVARSRAGLVFLDPREVWAFGAQTRLVGVHTGAGVFDVDLSLNNFEHSFGPTFVRVHRQWLVQLAHARALERVEGELVLFVGDELNGRGLRVPVARDRAASLRELLLSNAIGLRT